MMVWLRAKVLESDYPPFIIHYFYSLSRWVHYQAPHPKIRANIAYLMGGVMTIMELIQHPVNMKVLNCCNDQYHGLMMMIVWEAEAESQAQERKAEENRIFSVEDM